MYEITFTAEEVAFMLTMCGYEILDKFGITMSPTDVRDAKQVNLNALRHPDYKESLRKAIEEYNKKLEEATEEKKSPLIILP